MDTIIHIKSKKGIFTMEENKNIEMLSNEDNENNTTEYVDTDNITVDLCNGVTYVLDPESFDWENLSANKETVISNENTIMRMIHDIISQPDAESDECKNLIKEVTKTIDEFANSFKMDFDYSSFKLSDRELVLIKCFDALNVVGTLIREIKVYDAGFSAVKTLFESINNVSHYHNNDVEEPEDCCCDECCCCDDDGEECADVYSMPDIPKDELDAMFSALNGLGDIQSPTFSDTDISNIISRMTESPADDNTPTETEEE